MSKKDAKKIIFVSKKFFVRKIVSIFAENYFVRLMPALKNILSENRAVTNEKRTKDYFSSPKVAQFMIWEPVKNFKNKHMKNYHNILFFLSVVSIIIGSSLISCKRSTKEKVGRKIEIIPTNSKQVKLSQIFSSADVLNLNLNDIVYSKPKKMIIKDDHFFMLSRSTIIVCNTNGDLILHIARRGNGPGEYIGITDFHVEDNGDIIINDREGRKMIRYNSQGEYINTINHNLLSYNFIKLNDKIYLNSGNLINAESKYRINVWDEVENTLEQGYIMQDKELGYLSVMEYTNFS